MLERSLYGMWHMLHSIPVAEMGGSGGRVPSRGPTSENWCIPKTRGALQVYFEIASGLSRVGVFAQYSSEIPACSI